MANIDRLKIFQHKKINPQDSVYQKLIKLLDNACAYYHLRSQKSRPTEGSFFDVAKEKASNLGLHALIAEKSSRKNASPLLCIIDDKTEIIALKKPKCFRQKFFANALIYLFPVNKSINEILPTWSSFIASLYKSSLLIFITWLSVRILTNNPKSFPGAWPYLFALTFLALIGLNIINRINRLQRIITLDLALIYGLLLNNINRFGTNIKEVIMASRTLENSRLNLVYSSVFLASIIVVSLLVPHQNLLLLGLFSLVVGFIFLFIKRIKTILTNAYQKAHERQSNEYHYFLTVFPDLATLNLIHESNQNISSMSLMDFHSFARISRLRHIEKNLGFFIPFILIALVTINVSFFNRSLDLAHLLIVLPIGCLFYFHLRVFVYSFPRYTHHRPVRISSCEKIPIPLLVGQIELVDVSFEYPHKSELILNNLNLFIKPKTILGIFGASGSGKSTLIKILMAHHMPTKGQIIFDEHDGAGIDLNNLRKHMGIVTPDSRLMAGTLLENILVSRTFSKREIESLFSNRLFWPLLDLPMGLNTYILWHGHNISPKIASLTLLARSLIHQPTFLFLDEMYLGQTLQEEIETIGHLKDFATTTVITSHNIELSLFLNQSYELKNGHLEKLSL